MIFLLRGLSMLLLLYVILMTGVDTDACSAHTCSIRQGHSGAGK